ncbi:zinc finger protein 182 [Zeugodacus cucurbitae]|uniref:Zinc finger protein 436 n=1 Tax=Zeugodacus cucurbitae TaxID=28588 RepID=A0A0A1WGT8_ZEUCU|nr:zinc finger protein 182 [Zeugodacus cucurbitae]
MTMDLEKICRTCLGLSGPLLSIYDGGGGGGCIADMLRDFTKTKPRREDKLPEKVCLTCISEINRCYSFKLKCENSCRTLRQLVPDAPPEETEEEVSKIKVVQVNKFVQTMKEIPKQLTTVHTQTKENVEVSLTNQYVQTTPTLNIAHDKSTSPIIVEQNRTLRYDKNKLEKALGVEIGEEIEIVESSKLQRRNNVRHALSFKRCRMDESYEDIEEDGTEIIMELHTDEPGIADNSEGITLYSELHTAVQEDTSDNTTTYYQLSNSQSDNESENIAVNNENIRETKQGDEVFEEDGVIARFICTTEENGALIPVGNENSQFDDYNFTILKCDTGEAEVIAKRTVTVRSSKADNRALKEELKCSYCSMTFVNPKRLTRHELKRHANEQIRKENESRCDREQNNTKDTVEKTEISDDNEDSSTNLITADPTPVKATTSNTPQPIVQLTQPAKLTHFCETCGAGFALRRSLIHHKKQNLCNKTTYDCDKCQRVFISEETLKEHKLTHLQEHECTECVKLFATNDELSKHMVEVHKRNLRNQCPICKKVFTILSALKDHLRVHSGEKPFVCDICNKAFSQKTNLKQHIMRHSKEKKFKCDECFMTFVTKGELCSHKRTHTGEHPFRCDECLATFTISSSLVKHKRIHTGERPYACDLCPKRFTSSFTLKNHRRIHTGEKPFKCRWCSKTFTQKQDCIIHHRTHTGERNHICVCGEKFTHLGTLRTHMKTHEANDADGVPKTAGRGKKLTTRNKSSTSKGGSLDESAFNITIMDVDEDDEDNANDDEDKTTIVTVAREDMERLAAGGTLRRSQRANLNDEKLMQIAIEKI